MALGKRKPSKNNTLWITYDEIPESPGNPFYSRLNLILEKYHFDSYAENVCSKFYKANGRPGVPVGVYFRMIFVGYFEGIESNRGIAWRCADSFSIKEFLGYSITDKTPDHSTLTKIRQRLDADTHVEIFQYILSILAKEKLIKGKSIGIDATTLEANAAMRALVQRDTGEDYHDYIERLAEESGIESPTRQDSIKLDKKRKSKKMSNADWEHSHDPDSRIGKMKTGGTRMLHKSEHAVDLDTAAIIAVTIQPGDLGDTTTVDATLDATCENLQSLCDDPATVDLIHPDPLLDVATDKGYHSNATLTKLQSRGIRTYISEPDRGRRNWKGAGKKSARDAVYANRRRIAGARGKRLLKKRSEVVERTFAHCYNTGGLRRITLRGHKNILKRLLLHVCAYNLGLVMRKLFGNGTPRGLYNSLFIGLIRYYLRIILIVAIGINNRDK